MKKGRKRAFILEREWMAHGLLCRVVFSPEMGHRCGYVRVEKGHPFYRVNYDQAVALNVNQERLKVPIESFIEDVGLFGALSVLGGKKKAEKWLKSPDGFVRVHGGLGFSRSYLGGDVEGTKTKRGEWFFGWDTCHAGDYVPFGMDALMVLGPHWAEEDKRWHVYLNRLRLGEVERSFAYEAKLKGKFYHYWTLEEVVKETERLAEQLSLVALLGVEKKSSKGSVKGPP